MNVFDRAVEVLEEKGWCQGHAVSVVDGSVCALSALALARDELMPMAPLADLEHILPVPSVVRFNDDRFTRYEDVVALLKDGSRRFEDRKGGVSL